MKHEKVIINGNFTTYSLVFYHSCYIFVEDLLHLGITAQASLTGSALDLHHLCKNFTNRKTLQYMKNQRELTKMRDAELLRDYRTKLNDALERGEEINRMKIINEVLLDCHPRYYLQFSQAYNVITRINHKGITGRKLSLKNEMWLEIYEKTKALMAENEGMVMHEALTRVLFDGRASRYFISPQYAYRYIYDVQRAARDKRRIASHNRA